MKNLSKGIGIGVDWQQATFQVSVMERSIVDYMTASSWAGITSSFLTLGISLVLLYKLRFNWDRLLSDYHYRLRVILMCLLVFNRVVELVSLFTWLNIEKWTESVSCSGSIEHSHILDAYTYVNAVSWYFLYLSFVVMISLLLFLTLDRYSRIMMVLNGSVLYSFFHWTRIFIVVTWMFAAVEYFFRCWMRFVRLDLHRLYYKSGALSYAHIAHSGMVLFELLIHYIFTIKLLIQCIASASGQSTFLQLCQKYTKTLLSKKAVQELQEFEQRDRQRFIVGLKMISLFLCLVMADMAMVSLAATEGIITDAQFQNFYALSTSWVTVHVACLFKLLDMFLEELKTTNQMIMVHVVHHSSGRWYQRMARAFGQSESVSEPDNTFKMTESSTNLKFQPSIPSTGSFSKYDEFESLGAMSTSKNESPNKGITT